MRSVDDRSRGRDPAESDGAFGAPTWVALLPVSVVALGTPTQPVERLMTLQSGFDKLVLMLTRVRWPQPRPLLRGLLGFRFR